MIMDPKDVLESEFANLLSYNFPIKIDDWHSMVISSDKVPKSLLTSKLFPYDINIIANEAREKILWIKQHIVWHVIQIDYNEKTQFVSLILYTPFKDQLMHYKLKFGNSN